MLARAITYLIVFAIGVGVVHHASSDIAAGIQQQFDVLQTMEQALDTIERTLDR